jgi:serine protease Do
MRLFRWTRPGRVILARLLLVPVLAALPARVAAQEPRAATSTVFARYADRILKVQVMETGSSARASIGTGFFVGADGLMLTNYHVIAERIHEPGNYRVEVLDSAGTATEVEVIAVDVVHDLAVLRTGLTPRQHFTLGPVDVPQGERLYSLGHPSDLGLSIVEGTYNGNLRHTLYPKIHFTGSINPGMSGGPTITDAGEVVGVNVSTMGEQRSFLVPQAEAQALLARVRAPGFSPAGDPLAEIAGQLTAYQDEYLSGLLEGEPKMVDVGRFRVATEPSPIFRCWGDADRSNERLYERLWHACSTDDDVFIHGDQSSGMIDLEHQVLASAGLNAARFAALYTRHFSYDNTPAGDEKHVTEWSCNTRNVRAEGATMRAVLCLRRLRKLGGLYDAVLKVAVLGARDTGLISTLTLSGASYANIERLTARYLELITWR